MYAEDELLPLSALQHLLFCERQCALIHIERLWAENRLTVEGKQMHERVDTRGSESRGRVRVAHGMALNSMSLGLVGKADVVEFHRVDVAAESSRWQPFPVEYKRGRTKRGPCDRVQLCAQAMCLEEMLDMPVPAGALFYGATRRRVAVDFDEPLRERTRAAAAGLHKLLESGVTPTAAYEAKCDQCSLYDLCLPKTTGAGRSARGYLHNVVLAAAGPEEGADV